MKHIFKTLLGLVLVVWVLVGCSNPAGPETPEVIEPPVVETPEENVNLVKVEFRWCSDTVNLDDGYFQKVCTRYFLGLRPKSSDDYDYGYDYCYSYPKNQDDENYYKEIRKNKELLKKFYEEAFENVFGIKSYKEGTVIDLKQWTSKAVDLIETSEESITYTQLYFLAEDLGTDYEAVKIKSFDKIEVENQDIVVYIYWNMKSYDIY